jgi:hypothetical protein
LGNVFPAKNGDTLLRLDSFLYICLQDNLLGRNFRRRVRFGRDEYLKILKSSCRFKLAF